jgi:hypothetical protein
VQGAEGARQELYKVEVRADGGAVREDDAETEPLDDAMACFWEMGRWWRWQ